MWQLQKKLVFIFCIWVSFYFFRYSWILPFVYQCHTQSTTMTLGMPAAYVNGENFFVWFNFTGRNCQMAFLSNLNFRCHSLSPFGTLPLKIPTEYHTNYWRNLCAEASFIFWNHIGFSCGGNSNCNNDFINIHIAFSLCHYYMTSKQTLSMVNSQSHPTICSHMRPNIRNAGTYRNVGSSPTYFLADRLILSGE